MSGRAAGPAAGPTAAGPHDHVVQFYERDEELVEGVGGYLVDAVQSGAVAVIVATGAHRRAFERRMARAGIEVGAALAGGHLVCLDAGAAVDQLLVEGRVDGERFGAVLGEIVGEASRRGRPVHVYGEIVDLLWDAGRIDAAIELERLWNDLGGRVPFSLLCAYRTGTAPGSDDLDSLGEVCRLHSAVLGGGPPVFRRGAGDELSCTFPPDVASPRRARRFAVDALRPWVDEAVAEDTALVVSELATNAVLHAGSEFSVSVTTDGDTVRIAVTDSSPLPPVDRHPVPLASSGRGMGLVAAVAGRWAVEATREGKLVWAELPRR